MHGEGCCTNSSEEVSSTSRRRRTRFGLEIRIDQRQPLSKARPSRLQSRPPRTKISLPHQLPHRRWHQERLSSSRTSTSSRRQRGCKPLSVTSMDSASPVYRRNPILIKVERRSAWVTVSSGSVRSKMRLVAKLPSRIKLSMVTNSTYVSLSEVQHKRRINPTTRGHETRQRRRCSSRTFLSRLHAKSFDSYSGMLLSSYLALIDRQPDSRRSLHLIVLMAN